MESVSHIIKEGYTCHSNGLKHNEHTVIIICPYVHPTNTICLSTCTSTHLLIYLPSLHVKEFQQFLMIPKEISATKAAIFAVQSDINPR